METTLPPQYIPYQRLAPNARIEASANFGNPAATIEHEGCRYEFWRHDGDGCPWYRRVDAAPATPDADMILRGSELTSAELAEWAQIGVFLRGGLPYMLSAESGGMPPTFTLAGEPGIMAFAETEDDNEEGIEDYEPEEEFADDPEDFDPEGDDDDA
jgi:hypothetical protein